MVSSLHDDSSSFKIGNSRLNNGVSSGRIKSCKLLFENIYCIKANIYYNSDYIQYELKQSVKKLSKILVVRGNYRSAIYDRLFGDKITSRLLIWRCNLLYKFQLILLEINPIEVKKSVKCLLPVKPSFGWGTWLLELGLAWKLGSFWTIATELSYLGFSYFQA